MKLHVLFSAPVKQNFLTNLIDRVRFLLRLRVINESTQVKYYFS